MRIHPLAAPLVVAALGAGWLAVQRAWRRSFPGLGAEPDALAARGDGGGCHGRCEETCEPDVPGGCAGAREELS